MPPMVIVLLPRTFVRFDSTRTGETLLHACRLDDALIVYGSASRDYCEVGMDGDVVPIDGTLRDRIGPAISFYDDALRCHAKVLMDVGFLPEGHDGAWQRDQS